MWCRNAKYGEQPALLVQALRSYSDGTIIVYAPTIARVEETVDFLEEQGIPAIAYHGQMEKDQRRLNQERWMADEVRVLGRDDCLRPGYQQGLGAGR